MAVYWDQRSVERIAAVFDALKNAPALADADGHCLIPRGAVYPSFSQYQPVSGACARAEGFLFLKLECGLFLLLPEDTPGGEDLLRLGAALVTDIVTELPAVDGSQEAYRRILNQTVSEEETGELAKVFGLADAGERCVLLMEYGQELPLRDLIPAAERDVLVSLGTHSMALIKDLRRMDGPVEVDEYARAIQETVLEETGQEIRIGIGSARSTLYRLGESCSEARQAIMLGRKFRPEERVCRYTALLTEQLVSALPKEDAQRLRAMLFHPKTAKLFDEEMLATIDMFFRKDLSVSDAARALFIHRNTLMYRLDKVQKKTGLDLRKFDDAVCFRLISKLKGTDH